MIHVFAHAFLNLTLRDAIAVNGESQTLAVNTLIRRMLFELSSNSRDSPLLKVTVAFLCHTFKIMMTSPSVPRTIDIGIATPSGPSSTPPPCSYSSQHVIFR